MIQEINKIRRVEGKLTLPGDKSISHRSVIFSALAEGKSCIQNLLESEDVFSTIDCFRKLGCEIEKKRDEYHIEGKGFKKFHTPTGDLNAGNSGTTARLLSGVLAAQNFESKLIGDDSLSKRPMKRVTEPLGLMGAKIELSESGTLPAVFYPSNQLHPVDYELQVPSAQVKSAILLLGLHLEAETNIIEKALTRDHTERMLGCKFQFKNDKKQITVSRRNYPKADEYIIPSDISTAAFFIVLTLLSDKSELTLRNISLNPSRAGVLKILRNMGADITLGNKRTISGEELGDITVRSSTLNNVMIKPEVIPNIIDEIPILSAAGLFAKGKFVIKNASELRVKESDRIKSLVENYRLMGVKVQEFEDGFELSGDVKNENVEFDSFGDHRIAMTFAILSSLLYEQSKIKNFDCVKISNPNFLKQLNTISV